MTNRSSAARYARALLDVSRKEADPKAVEGDLAAFVALVGAHPPLKRALESPAIPAVRKTALVNDLLPRMGLSPIVGKLVVLLAERDRLVLLPDLLDEYRHRLLDALNIVQAEVTSAVPLAEEALDAISRAISDRTGRSVSLSAHVDRSIIGGVVTRIGSVVYDGSVKRQLEKMKDTLTSTT